MKHTECNGPLEMFTRYGEPVSEPNYGGSRYCFASQTARFQGTRQNWCRSPVSAREHTELLQGCRYQFGSRHMPYRGVILDTFSRFGSSMARQSARNNASLKIGWERKRFSFFPGHQLMYVRAFWEETCLVSGFLPRV